MARTLTVHTHCRAGHEYTPLNSKYKPSRGGIRECVECEMLRREKYAKAKKPKRPSESGKCMKGLHAWTDENVIYDKRGYGRCRPCRLITERAYHQRIGTVCCVVKGCERRTRRHDEQTTYICPKHRKSPPAWLAGRIARREVRIVGTEVLAA